MVYFYHVPAFNTITENEEQSWFLSPCGCSLLLNVLPWSLLLSPSSAHLPRNLPRVAMPSHQHGNHSPSWLSRVLLVLPSLQSPAFTSTIKALIPDPSMPRTWSHCTWGLTLALNLTDDIAKGCLLVSDTLAVLLEGSVVFVSSLCHQNTSGGVL